jgi:hypothetical protein
MTDDLPHLTRWRGYGLVESLARGRLLLICNDSGARAALLLSTDTRGPGDAIVVPTTGREREVFILCAAIGRHGDHVLWSLRLPSNRSLKRLGRLDTRRPQ